MKDRKAIQYAPPSANGIPRGHWSDTASGIKLACPRCAEPVLLDHIVDTAGNVHPSVVCGNLQCDFEGWVRLDGWEAE